MVRRKRATGQEVVNEQRRTVVHKVVEDMKRDGLRWSEPYLPHLSPRNPVSGTVYRGINRLHLGFVGMLRGYEDSRWCTFSNITAQGWHLKKGSKSAIIERWKTFPVVGEDEETGEDEVVGQRLRLVGYWNVYNASDIEGIPPLRLAPHVKDSTTDVADGLIRSSRCPVMERDSYRGLAAYSPSKDVILIASRSLFRSDEAFTRTLLHEMTHSTGHPSALGRDASTDFGSPAYAEEELVAELGSLFLSADLGIQSADMEGSFYENHVAYLQSWLHALEDDPSYLFRAASKADKAGSYILERYNERLQETERREMPAHIAEKVSLREEARDMAAAAEVNMAPRQPDCTWEKNVVK